MADPEPFGEILYVAAESIGVPGQRRFRLKVMNENGRTAFLWLEKEQLHALGEAIEAVLKNEGYEHHARPLDDMEPEPVFPVSADVDYQIGQLSMGLFRETERIVVNSAAAGEEETAGISFSISYPAAGELREQITRVVAAGRPPCPLCGGPMDPSGHICPRRNGHHAQT
jgi:uncharacterized repeat protein (TIGR03847 family)